MSQGQPTPDGASRAWRPSAAKPATAGKPPPSARSPGAGLRTLFVLLVAILLLGGATVAWLLLPRGFEEPYFLALPITEYGAPGLPANAWAEKDSDLLKQHFSKNRRPFNFQERHQLAGLLDDLREDKSPALVVYLNAHAVYRDGQVYLLPGNARLDQPDSWLPLAEVVKSLRRFPKNHRLLILDVMHPVGDAPEEPPDDIATHVHDCLKKELARDKEKPLWVLCACGPGQVSQVSRKADLSVFAYFLNDGLCGDAEGYKRGSKDGFVSVGDLAAFVADKVDRRARQRGGPGQRPVLLGGDADFNLVALASRQTQPSRPAGKLED